MFFYINILKWKPLKAQALVAFLFILLPHKALSKNLSALFFKLWGV